MLRNFSPCQCLLRIFVNQQRQFQINHGVVYNKSSPNVLRQGKIMGKLYGNRVKGSKKRWIPLENATQGTSLKDSHFGNKSNNGGKNATRRMTVLNKLFMKHITDLLATGEISERLLGKGLQVSRVKITQDFAYVNVFWLTTGEVTKDIELENELKRSSGLLRHELSQLDLMGSVPRINFVKDKLYTNASQVEALLKNLDLGEEENDDALETHENYATSLAKDNFYFGKEAPSFGKPGMASESTDENKLKTLTLPEMRHDVFGLDHKGIMEKILTKMRKSKQAWEQHQENLSSEMKEPALFLSKHYVNTKVPSKTPEEIKKFEAFLAKRRESKNTPERKKFRAMDHYIEPSVAENKEVDVVLSERRRQLYEAEDYLIEDEDKRR